MRLRALKTLSRIGEASTWRDQGRRLPNRDAVARSELNRRAVFGDLRRVDDLHASIVFDPNVVGLLFQDGAGTLNYGRCDGGKPARKYDGLGDASRPPFHDVEHGT